MKGPKNRSPASVSPMSYRYKRQSRPSSMEDAEPIIRQTYMCICIKKNPVIIGRSSLPLINFNTRQAKEITYSRHGKDQNSSSEH